LDGLSRYWATCLFETPLARQGEKTREGSHDHGHDKRRSPCGNGVIESEDQQRRQSAQRTQPKQGRSSEEPDGATHDMALGGKLGFGKLNFLMRQGGHLL
jgi:hypothetical protein